MATSDSSLQKPAPVKGGVTPYLTLSDANAASELYVRAFDAELAAKMPPDEKGRYMHIHVYVNGGSVMLCDAFPEHSGQELKPPASFTLHLQVDDIERWWARAVAAGLSVVMPLENMFWGDRYGLLRDPFGVLWSMGQTLPTGSV